MKKSPKILSSGWGKIEIENLGEFKDDFELYLQDQGYTGQELTHDQPAQYRRHRRHESHDEHGQPGSDEHKGTKEAQVTYREADDARHREPQPRARRRVERQNQPAGDPGVERQHGESEHQPDEVERKRPDPAARRLEGEGRDGPAHRGGQCCKLSGVTHVALSTRWT